MSGNAYTWSSHELYNCNRAKAHVIKGKSLCMHIAYVLYYIWHKYLLNGEHDSVKISDCCSTKCNGFDFKW